ncbi:MAG: cytosine permease [Sphingopyxis sp.]|nr:cytosine permease [Sphingopyxis sp.]
MIESGGKTYSGLQISIVQIGIVVALPAFISGAEIGFAAGLAGGSISILIGGLILASLAALTGTVGARTSRNTSELVQQSFGRTGGKLVSGFLAATVLGWFGVTAQLFGQSMQHMWSTLGTSPPASGLFVATGGILMIATTFFGFQSLKRVADIAVPLLFLLIIYTAVLALGSTSLSQLSARSPGTGSIGLGISATVGGLAVGVTLFPDLARFARSANAARLAAFLTFGIAMPSILFIALIPSIAVGERDLVKIMAGVGLGLPAIVLITFKAWTTNSGNLYSASLAIQRIVPRSGFSSVVVFGGSVGVLLALLGIASYFIPFLLVLSIAVPPVAGIYVTDFFLTGEANYGRSTDELPAFRARAFIAWGAASILAAGASQGVVTLSGIPACDAILSAAAFYFLLRWRPYRGRFSRF